MKEPLIRTLIKEALKEAELSIGKDNTNFGIRVDLGNPQSETKRGIRIKLIPRGVMLDPGKRGELESAIMTKFNEALKQFNLQISVDTDVPDPEIIGFFIPLDQLKSMIISAIQGPSKEEPSTAAPKPPPVPPKPTVPSPDNEDLDENVKKLITKLVKEQTQPLNEMRQRDLNEISKVVVREDFYNFINAGNNVLRSLEEQGMPHGKKYLMYLVKHNIM